MSKAIVIAQPNQSADRASQTAIAGKTTYEGTVIARAIARAGSNPHLKGHIHEVLVQDTRNLRNLLTANGATTQLTKSTTATTVDLVTTKGGKVIERIQVKDVTSKAGIDKLVKQCAQDKYRSAQLVGSEETAEAFNRAAEKAGISKRMTSTGVSSKTTESMAQRAGASGSGTLASATWQAARSGGAVGAAVGAGVALVKGAVDLYNGEADAVEVAGTVIKAGAKGGVSGAAAGASATVPSDLLIPAQTGTKLTSCFTEAGFTFVLRRRPEPSSPQALLPAELAVVRAKRSRFFAAFTSRSWITPQAGHAHARTASGSVSSLCPHAEQVLLLAKKRSAITTCPPRIAALYLSCRRNSKKLISAMERAKCRFAIMPRTLRFSTAMV